jgi:hypothetical protein
MGQNDAGKDETFSEWIAHRTLSNSSQLLAVRYEIADYHPGAINGCRPLKQDRGTSAIG